MGKRADMGLLHGRSTCKMYVYFGIWCDERYMYISGDVISYVLFIVNIVHSADRKYV